MSFALLGLQAGTATPHRRVGPSLPGTGGRLCLNPGLGLDIIFRVRTDLASLIHRGSIGAIVNANPER